jgi:anti-sigma regulatory factor (Ser/Thr protein kinase)
MPAAAPPRREAVDHGMLEEIAVASVTDATVAASAALRFSLRAGLPERAAREVAIVARELATNIVRHAGHGVVHLRAQGGVVEVEAIDEGAAAVDPASLLMPRVAAFVDPNGRAIPGLGEGLRAVERLSTEVEVRRAGARGLAVRAIRRA